MEGTGHVRKDRIAYLVQQEESSLKAYKAFLHIQAYQVEAWIGNPKDAKEYKKHLNFEADCLERALKKKSLK